MTTPKILKFANRDELLKLQEGSTDRWGHRSSRYCCIEVDELPWEGDESALGFPSHFEVNAYFISNNTRNSYWKWNHNTRENEKTTAYNQLFECPVFLQVNEEWSSKNKKFKPEGKVKELLESATDLEVILYDEQEDYRHWYHRGGNISWGDVAAVVEHEGHVFYLVMPWNVAEQAYNLEFTDDANVKFNNGSICEMPSDWQDRILNSLSFYHGNQWRDKSTRFDYTIDAVAAIHQKLPMNGKNMRKFLECVVNKNFPVKEIATNGIKKSFDRLQPFADELLESDPLTFCCYRSFANSCKRSVDGVKVSSVFNEVFKEANSAADIKEALKNFYDCTDGDNSYRANLEQGIKNLPVYKTKRKAVLKSQANRAFTKVMQEVESLSIDQKKHKRTWEAITEGKLPIGIFFRKSEQYFLLNDNWDLWEEMFKQGHGDVICEIATSAAGRSTYEKDLMSYFYFVAYGLPAYLKKHTKKKWTCKPKYVNTMSELEPPKEQDGVARKRSALTPIVDNENCTVEVPYASIRIPGRQTTYCYSHNYHVLTNGLSINGNAVTDEIEKKLNGRDDYGLMFYTLTGSHNARGYPTFLIIFERRERFNDTRVHFHRTHPSRSKDGDYNPIHNWIKVCYNWMVGNIKRDRIAAQQGDLAFVRIKTDKNDDSMDGAAVTGLSFDHKVDQYDSHCFEEPVAFAEYTKKAKSNILGYVNLEKDTLLRHNEHDNETIPEGTYAIHQARSWEANPKGVWSLRID